MADRVLLIRHCHEEPGVGRWPSLRELAAWQDFEGDRPLTARGRAGAQALADEVARQGADSMRTSPLRRAWETASVLAEHLGTEPVVDEELAEVSFGRPPGVDGPLGWIRLPRRAGFALMRGLWLLGLTRGVSGPGTLTRRVRGLAAGLEEVPGHPVWVTHGVVLVYLLSVMVRPDDPARPRRGHLPRAGELLRLERRSSAGWRITGRWLPP